MKQGTEHEKWGPHADAVNEVFDLARRPLLRGGRDRLSIEATVVLDGQRARGLAWDQVYDESRHDWTDLRERERGRVRGALYLDSELNSVGKDLSVEVEKLLPWIRRGLPPAHLDLLDDVIADLQGCALSRLAFGTTDRFFESLFAAYAAGGWPCGWEGLPPAGRAVVFFPERCAPQ